jgi:hypothetical protein
VINVPQWMESFERVWLQPCRNMFATLAASHLGASKLPSVRPPCRDHRRDVSALLTTMAFDQSGPRGLGISDLIAELEGPTFISYKVARSRLDRLRFVTQDPSAAIMPRQ